MNKETEHHASGLSLDEIRKKIAALRARLDEADQWPAKANLLLKKVRDPGFSISEADESMLLLLGSELMKGVDLQAEYPSFFKKLLDNQGLREAFLDALDLLGGGETEPQWPGDPPNFQVEILNAYSPLPRLQVFAQKWRATWQQTARQLSSILLSRGPEPAYRGDDFLEDLRFTLISSYLLVDELQLRIHLEATQSAETPDELSLMLFSTLAQPSRLPALEARLQWGAYDQSIRLDEQGQVPFAPIQVAAILDPESETVKSALILTVEPGA